MLTAKIHDNHDYIRLSVKEGKARGSKGINLTMSRYGEKCSGVGLTIDEMRAALNAYSLVRDAKGGGTIGDRVRAVHALAESSADLAGFLAALKTHASTLA